jgi:hypothetical protein
VRALHGLLSGGGSGTAQQSLLADRSFSAALTAILCSPASPVRAAGGA